MGKHDALISGSFAIQFFERVMWKESDLDIFIGQGPGAEALEDYLCKQEGYSLSHEMKEGEYWFHTRLIKVLIPYFYHDHGH